MEGELGPIAWQMLAAGLALTFLGAGTVAFAGRTRPAGLTPPSATLIRFAGGLAALIGGGSALYALNFSGNLGR